MKKRFLIFIVAFLVTFVVGASFFVNDSVNILVYGLEGKRSDTMMVVMLDASKDSIHVISVPRDTYNPVEGHNGLGAKKLNAVYGFKEGGGTEGLISSVERITGIRIDHYIEVEYEGVKSVVDLVGGIPVNVPFDMKYSDPTATPPLYIDLKEGEQVLQGDDVIGYLRFRKSSDGKIREGDIQRIDRQQAFLKSAAVKVLSWKLPIVAKNALEYVQTDLTTFDTVKLGLGMIGASQDDLYFHVLPQERIGSGKDGLSYVFHSPEQTEALIQDIHNGVFDKEDPVEE
ncbi:MULTISPECIES: LCP family protein [unclassified Fusibacter]|uniref:LCP family protein n=1 Tax=unclassified Fusibacter TaxID=2624464 RepID=UPI00101355FC|nr:MULTISPECIES: LCP family protein [unclassified Fusibacter]MCK8061506.1 LCP family protein [Fusibacter sp. A2]NPE23691.1 LCP family protein [Fusibacter sp. A1]RXV58868.1 LytR family transcriptional regulator [Fusibacter sp. A1]